MKTLNGHSENDGFDSVVGLLKSLDPEAVGALVGLGADIVMLVDDAHAVHRIYLADEELGRSGLSKAEGKRLQDLVTIESVPKIDAMLAVTGEGRRVRGYQVNHRASGRPDLPVVYSAYGGAGFPFTLVVGRELRQQMRDQQRLVETQMELESEYRELQEAEARYRTAFQISAVGHIMVDGEKRTVLDANVAALSLLSLGNNGVVGKPLRELFDKDERDRLSDAVGEARHAPHPVSLDTILSAKGVPVSLGLRAYRENGFTNLIVTVWPSADAGEARRQRTVKPERHVVDLSDLPEAAVQTSADGVVLAANAAFLDIVHAPSLPQVLGRPVSSWFAKSALDIHVLYSRLAEEPVVRGFSATLTDNLAADRPVLISARRNPQTLEIQMILATPPALAERLAIPAPGAGEQQAEGFANLVGKVPLKDLMRESLDVIEKICIEAALDQTHNNRALAAQMLGLSRQSLYIKLRRYGLEDYRPAVDGH
ncbi:transcriptional regulator PpsR [Rhizobium sp. RU20A]|uniref:helix-turn-helix domain-containing protein n=1 Tax=Rhizobium sp. RU20A TaxID=1907412 RepID=UPI000955BEC1|nr:helix-turn-helix domain-containing protein [Rhizobium sp. RU20A]SIR43739.1 transcriptional regulator PpsR [Rhizobium sp. RU20A]